MKSKVFAVTVLSILYILTLTSCTPISSTDNSGSGTTSNGTSTTNPGTSTTAVIGTDIAGTWKVTSSGNGSTSGYTGTQAFKSSYTYIKETITTINADGNYNKQEKWFKTSKIDISKTWTEWNLTKGTISIKDNLATFSQTHSFYSSADTIDPTTITWSSSTVTLTTNLRIINNKLCINALRRQNTGSGIIGTWMNIVTTQYTNNTKYYTKEEYILSSTTLTWNYYSDTTGLFLTPSLWFSFTYTLKDNATFTVTDTTGNGTENSFLIQGDWILFEAGADKV